MNRSTGALPRHHGLSYHQKQTAASYPEPQQGLFESLSGFRCLQNHSNTVTTRAQRPFEGGIGVEKMWRRPWLFSY